MEQKTWTPQGKTSIDRAFHMMVSEINSVLNRRIDLFNRTKDKNVLIRHLVATSHEVRLQPTYATFFYFHEEIEHIVRRYDWSIMWRAETSSNGVCAPVMEIYRAL